MNHSIIVFFLFFFSSESKITNVLKDKLMELEEKRVQAVTQVVSDSPEGCVVLMCLLSSAEQ